MITSDNKDNKIQNDLTPRWKECGMFDDFLECPYCHSKYVAERVQSEEWAGCPKCLNPVRFI